MRICNCLHWPPSIRALSWFSRCTVFLLFRSLHMLFPFPGMPTDPHRPQTHTHIHTYLKASQHREHFGSDNSLSGWWCMQAVLCIVGCLRHLWHLPTSAPAASLPVMTTKIFSSFARCPMGSKLTFR